MQHSLNVPETVTITRRDGATLTVHPADWPIVSLDHALVNGIRQLIGDAAAGQKTKADAEAFMAKKAGALAKGEIRQARTSTVPTLDKEAKDLIKKGLIFRTTLRGKELAAEVDRQFDLKPDYWRKEAAGLRKLASGLEIEIDESDPTGPGLLEEDDEPAPDHDE
ncbi:MAG: hypothetical protein KGJ13_13110 [Patescibacteria group bacterium]|nr:hypothetical protein [Patescibacteria group bacterium]